MLSQDVYYPIIFFIPLHVKHLSSIPDYFHTLAQIWHVLFLTLNHKTGGYDNEIIQERYV